MPAITVVLLVILCAFPALLVFSKLGPGAMRAPLAISLVAGLVVESSHSARDCAW